MSAGLSVVVDVFVYCVLVKWLLLGLPLAPRLFFAAVIARTLSSVVNYTCNRRLPYVQNKKIGPTVAKYYCLWLAQLMLSFVGVWAAWHRAAHGRHAGQAAGGRASGRGQLPGAASLGVQ